MIAAGIVATARYAALMAAGFDQASQKPGHGPAPGTFMRGVREADLEEGLSKTLDDRGGGHAGGIRLAAYADGHIESLTPAGR